MHGLPHPMIIAKRRNRCPVISVIDLLRENLIRQVRRIVQRFLGLTHVHQIAMKKNVIAQSPEHGGALLPDNAAICRT